MYTAHIFKVLHLSLNNKSPYEVVGCEAAVLRGESLHTSEKKRHVLMSAWHGGTTLKAMASGKNTNQKNIAKH